MFKRQQRALKQLQEEINTTKEQEHKELTTESSDEDDTNQPKKRLRADEIPKKDTTDFPRCEYCHQHYLPAVLEKHKQRCPQKPKPPGPLKQSLLTNLKPK
jgi:hypothetical protein